MNDQPPRIGRWLLRWIYDDDHFDEVWGDLEEIFQDRLQSRGRFVASVLYLKDVILSVPNLNLFRLNPAMIGNLVTIALRSLRKRMSYSILNIAGLATSIAFAFMLWLYISDQSSYDKHYPLADRIYRVNLEANMNGKVDVYCNVPQPTAEALKSTYSQIEETARIGLAKHIGTLEYKDKKIKSANFVIADPSVLKLFHRDFIEGIAATALSEPGFAIITESIALGLFGQSDVVGRVVHFNEFEKDLTIRGVIADDARRSHFPMDVIVSWDTFKEFNSDRWYGYHTYTYILLNNGNDVATLDHQMPAFFDRYFRKTFDEFNGKGRLFFQPLTDIYLSDELVWEPNPHGSRTNVLALSLVALLLVAFAVINYVNLATAQAADRAMEVSIRKTMGSSRQLLWSQFLYESILLSAGAAVLSIGLAWMLLPFFNDMSGMKLRAYDFFTLLHINAILLLAVGVGFLAGIFPAFYLSSSPAVNSLKGKFSVSPAGEILRRVLVTTQYFIAALLISGIMLIYNQVVFIKNKEIGFQRENLLNIKVPSDSVVNNHIDVYMNDIKTSPRVIAASLGSIELHGESNSFSPTLQNEDGSRFQMGSDLLYVDADFIPTIGAEIVAGRNFDKAMPTDREGSVLINEAAVRKFGWQKNPLGGKFVGFTPREVEEKNIVGVVKDFHLGVSYQLVHPTIIFFTGGGETNLYVRLNNDDPAGTLATIEATWTKHFPNHKIEYSFVDQDLKSLYTREDNFLSLLTSFCVAVVFIASLGIIGLISYTTQLRKKEIAIRKVLGSTFSNTIAILSRKFIFLVIIANILAIPATWYIVRLWLTNFSYHADWSPLAFVAPLGICLLFTAFSIVWHTSRAALANPAEALKCE